MKKIKIGLLGKIIVAIMLGIAAGLVSPEWIVRIFLTFNGIFSQFLGFAIPLIILGLVTTAIADIGNGAGKMLLLTVTIAYGSTVLAGIISYLTGASLFPSMINSSATLEGIESAKELAPYFSVSIPPLMNVMTALILAFTLGLGLAALDRKTLKDAIHDFEQVIIKTIKSAIIPLLPLYIFGIFLNMCCNSLTCIHILSECVTDFEYTLIEYSGKIVSIFHVFLEECPVFFRHILCVCFFA
jgi:Na+/H+-dicarboxylate symporter